MNPSERGPITWPLDDVTRDGHEFILEEADEFEKQVTQLGSSDRFMRFLKERPTEEAPTPFDHIAQTRKRLEM